MRIILFSLLIASIFMGFVTASVDVGVDDNIGVDLIPKPSVNNVTYSNYTTHSDFWDALDTPADITDFLRLTGANFGFGSDWLYYIQPDFWFNVTKLATIYYDATQSDAVTGTIDGGTLADTQHSNGAYDGITFNFSEEAGSPALDLRINFTGIEDFNSGVMRYKTSTLFGSSPEIQLWNYDLGVWEDYPYLSESLTYSIITQAVYDSTGHINNGVVQMRLYKESNGNINNHYYVDWFAVSRGYGTPAGEETDPYSWHRDTTGESGNFYTSGNLTALGWNITLGSLDGGDEIAIMWLKANTINVYAGTKINLLQDTDVSGNLDVAGALTANTFSPNVLMMSDDKQIQFGSGDDMDLAFSSTTNRLTLSENIPSGLDIKTKNVSIESNFLQVNSTKKSVLLNASEVNATSDYGIIEAIGYLYGSANAPSAMFFHPQYNGTSTILGALYSPKLVSSNSSGIEGFRSSVTTSSIQVDGTQYARGGYVVATNPSNAQASWVAGLDIATSSSQFGGGKNKTEYGIQLKSTTAYLAGTKIIDFLLKLESLDQAYGGTLEGYGIYDNSSSARGWYLKNDNKKLYFGTGNDAFQYWDGTNQILNTTTGALVLKNNTGYGEIIYGHAIEMTPTFSNTIFLSTLPPLENILDENGKVVKFAEETASVSLTDFDNPEYTWVSDTINITEVGEVDVNTLKAQDNVRNVIQKGDIITLERQEVSYPNTEIVEGKDRGVSSDINRIMIAELKEKIAELESRIATLDGGAGI